MESIRNISWKQLRSFLDHNQKHVLVGFVFLIFILYGLVIQKYIPLSDFDSSGRFPDQNSWDITRENREKIYENVLQGQAGDWYRVGIATRANTATRMNVFLHSSFDDMTPVGSFNLEQSTDFKYHEMTLQIPKDTIFTDVLFVLPDDGNEAPFFGGVKFSEIFVSRLAVQNKLEADRLKPTLMGNIVHDVRVAVKNLPFVNPNSIFESNFIAEHDFIDGIVLNAKEKINNRGYIIELRERVVKGSNENSVAVRKVILKPGELESLRDEKGYQVINFSVLLKKGKEYFFDIRGIGRLSREIELMSVKELNNSTEEENGDVALVFGRNVNVDSSQELLSGAKVEDSGSGLYYTYSFQKGKSDYFDLYDIGEGVKYDPSKRMVVGPLQKGVYFTYKFNTVYPFEKIRLIARQVRDEEKEIKVEYSLDKKNWREIPTTEIDGGLPGYKLTLQGLRYQTEIYMRTTFVGVNKKTGVFALDKLSVQAKLIKK